MMTLCILVYLSIHMCIQLAHVNAMAGETRLVHKLNSKSIVWTYFGLGADDMGYPYMTKKTVPCVGLVRKQY